MTQEQAATEPTQPALSPPEAAAPSPPPQEQAPPEQRPPVPQSKPRPTVNVPALQSGFTQLSQRNSEAKAAVGLTSNASHEEYMARLAELQQTPALTEEMPPELQQQYADLNARSWQLAGQSYGDEFTAQVQHIQEVVMSTADPLALAGAVYELAQQMATTAQNAPPSPPSGGEAPANGQAPAEQAPAPQQQAEGIDMELGVPGWKVETDAEGEVASGDTEGFFSRVYAQARR